MHRKCYKHTASHDNGRCNNVFDNIVNDFYSNERLCLGDYVNCSERMDSNLTVISIM